MAASVKQKYHDGLQGALIADASALNLRRSDISGVNGIFCLTFVLVPISSTSPVEIISEEIANDPPVPRLTVASPLSQWARRHRRVNGVPKAVISAH